ncbi:hypothetical protein [Deinococcus sonorensis]|uniref:IPT/TIG domain-containing protein n=2 Tax=Deinococcus sonorensis TaxID=309891 RepID=A0AAU7U7L2_9DEIO
MNKYILTALSALILTGSAFASTQTQVAVSAGSDGVSGYQQLYTEASWQTIWVPLSAIGGVVPSNLNLQASGLPDGVTVTLTGTSVMNGSLLLTVDTERANTALPVNSMATLTLRSGTTALTTFQLPVVGVAYTD